MTANEINNQCQVFGVTGWQFKTEDKIEDPRPFFFCLCFFFLQEWAVTAKEREFVCKKTMVTQGKKAIRNKISFIKHWGDIINKHYKTINNKQKLYYVLLIIIIIIIT